MIQPDGYVKEILVKETTDFLDVYDMAFGADTIDVVPINAKMETVVIIGDHSAINGQPINMTASLWLAATGRYGGIVCGNVVVFGCDMQGEETSLHPAVFEEFPNFRQPNSVIQYIDPIGTLLRKMANVRKAVEDTDV